MPPPGSTELNPRVLSELVEEDAHAHEPPQGQRGEDIRHDSDVDRGNDAGDPHQKDRRQRTAEVARSLDGGDAKGGEKDLDGFMVAFSY